MEQEPKIPAPNEAPPEGETTGRRDLSRLVSILESLLLVSAQPLSMERIGVLLGGLSKQEAGEVIRAVKEKYSAEGSGILVEEVAKGLQLRTNPANQEYVRRLFETKPPRFSRPSLETLAVVAYRQPVTRLEIEQIRGVDCAGALRTLMERRLVRVVGKKDVAGRPFLFGTTREFLEVFSLASLSELPSMRDIEEFLAAKAGTPAPAASPSQDLFTEIGDQEGEGKELAAELDEAGRGEMFMPAAAEIPEGISDDVLVEGASMAAADSSGIRPIPPAGRGASRFAHSGEQFTEDPAEPLVNSSPSIPEGASDDGADE